MNNLKFTLGIVVPKRKESVRTTKESKLVKATVIEEDGTYKALVELDGNGTDFKIYPFTEDSWSLVGRENVFTRTKDKNGKVCRIIRDKFKAKFMPGLPEQYTPFAPNWTIKGYIVKENFIKKFQFKDLVGIEGYSIKALTPNM